MWKELLVVVITDNYDPTQKFPLALRSILACFSSLFGVRPMFSLFWFTARVNFASRWSRKLFSELWKPDCTLAVQKHKADKVSDSLASIALAVDCLFTLFTSMSVMQEGFLTVTNFHNLWWRIHFLSGNIWLLSCGHKNRVTGFVNIGLQINNNVTEHVCYL